MITSDFPIVACSVVVIRALRGAEAGEGSAATYALVVGVEVAAGMVGFSVPGVLVSGVLGWFVGFHMLFNFLSALMLGENTKLQACKLPNGNSRFEIQKS